MRVKWSDVALRDIGRLHEFLARNSPRAGAAMVRRLHAAADRLAEFPRIGVRIEQYAGQEVRRIIVDDYELRYEIVGDVISVVRVWHTREDR